MKFKRGLIAGRFQPFHKGHLAFAGQALAECNELIIVIGSAQFNFIDKDPFTAGERVVMIHDALEEAGAKMARYYIIPVTNDENNARWLANLRSQVPPFDVLYSGNDFVDHLAKAEDASLIVKRPKFANIKEWNGTNIRAQIAAGKRWNHLVPPAVAKTIEKVGGTERIKVLFKSDSAPQRW